jgi:type II secretory pathway pseudopilin PulG
MLRTESRRQAGFTLVEALVAMLVLTFGLIAITNLLIVASTSNSVANHSTAAATQASEVLERLRAVRFTDLRIGGDLGADVGVPNCDPDTDVNECIPRPMNNYNMRRSVDGVGFIKVRWQVCSDTAATNCAGPGAAGPDTLFIVVRAESEAPLAGARSRAEFTTFRTCTAASCP